MRRILIPALVTLLGAACSDAGEPVNLDPETPCADDSECGDTQTCFVNKCLDNGALVIGDTCSKEAQCGLGLICHQFICKPGCTDIYYIDDCEGDTWCKPIPDAFIEVSEDERIPVGDCTPSECDPRVVDFCPDGSACVAILAHIGACLPYCEYGFIGNTYSDTCVDPVLEDHACQPLGFNQVPVCLPAHSGMQPAPQFGCDGIRAPCEPDKICIDVVCRQLCTQGQAMGCKTGESCRPVGQRSDVFYCRAD